MKHRLYTAILGAAYLVAGIRLVSAQTEPPPPDPIVVFDETIILGDTDPMRSAYVSLSTDTPHEGMNCLKSEQDAWHVPMVRFGLNDVSKHKALEFWLRSAAESWTIYVQVAGYQVAGAAVPVTATQEWNRIRIPIVALAGESDVLTRAWDIRFDGKAPDGGLSTFWLDDIRFVNEDSTVPPPPVEPEPTPDPEPTPEPEPTVTWGEWHFAGFEIIEERTSSDRQTQRRSSPLILKLGAPEVQP